MALQEPDVNRELDALLAALRRAWARETSYDPRAWSPDNPAWGQCAATALVIWERAGGDVLRCEALLPDGRSILHYFNRLPSGVVVDATWEQFPDETMRSNPRRRRPGGKDTKRRAKLLQTNIAATAANVDVELAEGHAAGELKGLYEDIYQRYRRNDPQLVPRRVIPEVLDSRILLVGQALAEKTQRLSGIPYHLPGNPPTISRGGRVLDKFLTRFGYTIRPDGPGQYAYHADLANYFPGRKGRGMGDDLPVEVGGWLEKELELVRPRIVVTLGVVPTTYLLERYAGRQVKKLSDVAGSPITCNVLGHDLDVIPVHHPSGAFQHPTSQSFYERAVMHIQRILKEDHESGSKLAAGTTAHADDNRSTSYHEPTMSIRAGVLTISDKASRGERVDTSGAAITELLASIDASIERSEVVPDEREQIAETLRSWADSDELDAIITTGGTGLGPRDVTPEATQDIIERPVPGLGELMRAAGVKHTPMAALSRGVAGVRGRCLIVNLPGSEKGVRQNLAAVIDLLPHAVELLRGRVGDHAAP